MEAARKRKQLQERLAELIKEEQDAAAKPERIGFVRNANREKQFVEAARKCRSSERGGAGKLRAERRERGKLQSKAESNPR